MNIIKIKIISIALRLKIEFLMIVFVMTATNTLNNFLHSLHKSKMNLYSDYNKIKHYIN
jgi:hypothetical protein